MGCRVADVIRCLCGEIGLRVDVETREMVNKLSLLEENSPAHVRYRAVNIFRSGYHFAKKVKRGAETRDRTETRM